MGGVIVTPMKKLKAAMTLCAVALFLASCGSILPGTMWYPVDTAAPPIKKEQKADAAKPAPPAGKPSQVAAGEGQDTPLAEGDAVVFGEAPNAKEASSGPAPAARSSANSANKVALPENPERLANPLAMIMPALDQKVVPLPPVDARESSLGNNALARTFAIPFDHAWEKTMEVMLAAPITVVDKSSGLIVTEWMVQQRIGGGVGVTIFGDGQRTVRYKYAVKIDNRDGAADVTVIPYTQYSEGRQWVDGKPRRMISEHLMRLIVAKLEAK